MKNKRQKQFFIIYCLLIIAISGFSLYALFRLETFSMLSILLSICIFIFIILFFLYLSSKNITFQKMQWLLAIALCISSIFALQKDPIKVNTGDEYVGLDISKWNGSVDLQNVIVEIDFVIIRCGYTSNIDGTNRKIDDQFEANLKQCIDLGIPYGVYYYSLANTPELAILEAEYTLSLLDGNIPPLGVYIDVEDEAYQGHLTRDEITEIVIAFNDIIEESGNQPGVYANYYWWNNKLDHSALDPYLKWIAFYSEEYEIEEMYHMHQYTDQGTLSGINGMYDLNIVKEKFW